MTTFNAPSLQYSEHVLSYPDATNESAHLAPIAPLQLHEYRAHRELEVWIDAD